MPDHEIVSRQAVIQVVGPSGPVNVGSSNDYTLNREVETHEVKHADGANSLLAGSQEFPNGTINVNEYDGALARLMDDAMNPGNEDPIRHIVVFTENYNGGTSQTEIVTGVLFYRNGKTVGRGQPVANAVEWKGEHWQLA